MEENCNTVSVDSASASKSPSLTEWHDMDIYDTIPARYQECNALCDATLSNSCEDPGSLTLVGFSDNENIDSQPSECLTSVQTEYETADQDEESIYAVPILCDGQPYTSPPLKHSQSESTCLNITSVQNTNSDFDYYGKSFYNTSKEALSLQPLLDDDVVSIQAENLYETLNIKSKQPPSLTPEKHNGNLRKRIFRRKKPNKKWNIFRRSDPFGFSTSLTDEGDIKKQNTKLQTQKSAPVLSQAVVISSFI
eukprot:XP_014776103.1 PREDICTED: uncharacterized protein LOC106873304 [Octopus bimaculoides]